MEYRVKKTVQPAEPKKVQIVLECEGSDLLIWPVSHDSISISAAHGMGMGAVYVHKNDVPNLIRAITEVRDIMEADACP